MVRTIHFAHLTLISNGSRLLFLANFDGTWNNYLVDFIEKAFNATADAGLDQWRRFPADTLLRIRRGHCARPVVHQFGNGSPWRAHPALYWFRAYASLSVQQIRRQARIADGLRKPSLKQKEARAWAMDL